MEITIYAVLSKSENSDWAKVDTAFYSKKEALDYIQCRIEYCEYDGGYVTCMLGYIYEFHWAKGWVDYWWLVETEIF